MGIAFQDDAFQLDAFDAVAPAGGFTLYIAGVDRTAQYYGGESRGNLRLSLGLMSRWECTFPVYDNDDSASAYRPDLDELVEWYLDGVLIFSGHIMRVEDRPRGGHFNGVVTDVTARAARAITDQVIFDTHYDPEGEWTRKTMVQDLIANQGLAAFGIVADPAMTTGATMDKTTFDKVSAAEAFTYISEITGDIWRLRPDNVFECFAPGDKTAAFSLTDSNGNQLGPVTWEKSRGQYCNKVHLTYGKEMVVLKSFSATGDGVTTTFPLDYEPILTFAGDVVSQGVITEGVDSYYPLYGTVAGVTWTYDSGSQSLVRTPALPAGTPAVWQYAVQFPLTVTVADAGEIAAKGIWEKHFTAPDIFDLDEATAYAGGILRRSIVEPQIVTVRTRAGFELPGTTITLTFPDRTISGSHLITDVDGVDTHDGRMLWTFKCLSGSEAQASWTNKLRSTLRGGGRSGGGTVSGGIIPTSSATADGDVVANAGLNEGAASRNEASLRGNRQASAYGGPALVLGRLDDADTWQIVADRLAAGGEKGLFFAPVADLLSADYALALVQPTGVTTAGEFDLVPYANKDIRIGGQSTRWGGTAYYIKRIDAWDIHAATAFYERGRTAPIGEWTAFTPTFTTSNADGAIGNGTIVGRYMQLGKTVFVKIAFTAGSTTNFGTGVFLFGNLPVAATNGSYVAGHARLLDPSGSGTFYVGAAYLYSTTAFAVLKDGDTSGGINGLDPFTWTTDSSVVINANYEIP